MNTVDATLQPGADDGSLIHAANAGRPWRLWTRQALAILRLEVGKTFLGKRSIPVYLLAAAPVLVMIAVLASRNVGEELATLGGAHTHFAWMFQLFSLTAVIYFGCVLVFMNLFRGDIIDRSLHFYFLTPVRREVLVAGKYLAGLLTTSVLFGLSTLTTVLLLYSNTAKGLGAALAEGSYELFAYLGVTFLACLGYGAVFLVFGLFFRNPILPAIGIYGWELANFLLPPLLKRFSIIYYLKSLCPVPVPEGPFALLSDPPAAWVSVSGLVVLVAALLVVAAWGARRMEIRYSED